MFTHTQSGSERLAIWRGLRQDSTITTPQDVVSAFASMVPETRYLDFYTPNSWPTVFELVEEGMFCNSAITLVMAATLDYFGFISSDELRLDAISSHVTNEQGIVLIHQELVYNFIPGQIVSYQYLAENSTRYDSHIIAIDKLYS